LFQAHFELAPISSKKSNFPTLARFFVRPSFLGSMKKTDDIQKKISKKILFSMKKYFFHIFTKKGPFLSPGKGIH
jgi:hypothetical protein